jgi:hypothetical protein
LSLRSQRYGALSRLAALALIPAGAFAVHQLRYWLAFGSRAGLELQRQGHSYLHSLVPWLVLLIGLGAGAFLRALGQAFSGQSSLSRYTVSFAALWLICAACLVGIYVVQELLEGLFLTGHPAGLAGVFGYGGWWSIPAAVCIGLVLAAVFHGANWALHEVARRCAAAPLAIAAAQAPRLRPADVLLCPIAPLAGGWSGRGPPLG